MMTLALSLAALPLAMQVSTVPVEPDSQDVANCHVGLTSDYLSRTIMYSGVAKDAVECREKAAKYAEDNNFKSMANTVAVLFYEVEFRGRPVVKVNLKA